MRIVNLYLSKEMVDRWGKDTWSKSPIFKTFAVNDNEDLWGKPLLIDGKFYSVGSSQGNNYTVTEMEFYKHDEDIEDLKEINDDNLMCPVCGHEESDCWEYTEDEKEEHECSCCGSIISWYREYTVTYTTAVKKIQPFIDLK